MLLFWLLAAIAAGALTYAGIALAFGWLRRRAVAAVTARSSHDAPTPQGAGIVIVPVVLAVAGLAFAFSGGPWPGGTAYAVAVACAALMLVVVGFIDDVAPLGVGIRLGAQLAAVAVAILLAPETLRIVPAIAIWAERAVLVLAGLWFVNLFNFMDGIDGISATETVAIALGVAILAALGIVGGPLGLFAAVLIGAMAGFAPWNAPRARIFLGDAGSLPLGFLLGVLLFHVAATGAVMAALILPLYYLADATVTLLRRAANGEAIWQPHREHFYQQAVRNGFTVRAVIARIAVLDLVLVALAVEAVSFGPTGGIAAAIAAVAAVAALLVLLARGRR